MSTDTDTNRRPPKLDDVARLANVAKSTVSRVLLGEKTLTIRAETRQRVLDAIEILGYRPNPRARSLRTQRSMSLGLVVPEIDNPAFTTIFKGAQRAALASNYSLLIAFVETAHPDRALYRRLVYDNQVDGLLVTTIQNPELMADLRELGTRYVLVNREIGQGERAVIVDYMDGTRQAVQSLAELGHRRIAYVSGPLDNYTGRKRLSGFLAGHQQCALAPDMRLVAECDYSRATAQAAMQRLLDHPDGAPTAVCAANAVISSGILAAASSRGLSVPHDLSVICLLDAPATEMLTPTITSVQFPFFELGHCAASDLIDAIENDTAPGAVRVLPPLGIAQRESTAPPRQAAIR